MSSLRRWLGNPRIALLFAIIYAASQATIVHILQGGHAQELLIQLQLTYDAASFNQLLGNASPEQIQALQQHFVYDYIHPAWYGLMTLALVSWLMNINGFSARWNKVLIPAIIFPLLDVLENNLHSPWIYLHSVASDPWVLIAGTAATVKWLLAIVYLLFALLLTVRFFMRRPQAGHA